MLSHKGSNVPLGVVIVHYGDPNHTYALLTSLAKQKSKHEVYVVDNDPLNRLSEQKVYSVSHSANLIRMPNNVGWAGGCNAGAKVAIQQKCKILTFLTADTLIVRRDFIKSIARNITENEKRASLPIVVYQNNPELIWMAGASFNKETLSIKANHTGQNINNIKSWEKPNYGGIGLTLSTSIFKKINGWDTDYFLYYEDVDICHKLEMAGCELVLEPNALVAHRTSTAKQRGEYKLSGLSAYCYGRAGFIYIKKNMKGYVEIVLPLFNLLFVQTAIFIASMGMIHNNYLAILRYIQGMLDGMRILFFASKIDNTENNLGRFR